MMYRVLFIIFLTTVSVAKGDLLFPENGSLLNYTHVLFQWEQEPDASSYNLQVLNQFFDVILDINNPTTAHIVDSVFYWNRTYYWKVRPVYQSGEQGNWGQQFSFSTGNSLPADLDIEINNDSLIQDGLMMYTEFLPAFGIRVIDKYGNQIWNTQSAIVNYWNEYGQLYGRQWPDRGVQITFYNQNLWITPEGYEVDLHEIKQIPNGNYMAFVGEYQLGPIALGDWTQSYQDLGFVADGVTNEIQWRGCKIVEWDKDTGDEVWSWDPFEHFSMDDYDTYFGTWWHTLYGTNNYGALIYDWMHSNSFHFDEVDSVIYTSSRYLSRISKIAYPSGEVIWNMGPPAEYGLGDDNICTDLGFSMQHHIQLLDDGDLLFFDNGNLSEMFMEDEFPTTRLRRIRVVDDSSCVTVWQYEMPPDLFGGSTGSVQLLENGNYYTYTGGNHENEAPSNSSLLEITTEGEVVWRATSENVNTLWYRSYKIPSIHPIAMSVIFDGYRTIPLGSDTLVGIMLDDAHPSLTFTIYNQSGYSQPYSYTINDDQGWFSQVDDSVFIEAGEQLTLSFEPDIQADSTSSIQLEVKPVYHSWAHRELNFDIYRFSGLLDVDGFSIPEQFFLDYPYPNPFNPATHISFTIPSHSDVKITVFDILGNEIVHLVDGPMPAGRQKVVWNAQTQPSGIYFIRLRIGAKTATRKMMLLK